ncbi:DsbA family protein [Bacillus carboniphilus]|uniref:DsbA family protein n=1 Tax=Bacillus carboniphilus TaxID=86663 RepID=A0ABY9JRT5_9BACI|nr:DsbA family protein [Bacillus carboniphilus]WLR42101.1 DsbA family protein [Bacillus carboniphilus]
MQKKSPFKIIVILTLVVVALLVAIFFINKMSQENNQTTYENQPSVEGQPVLGDEDAPVTVVEFGDFLCPTCKAWGEQVFPQLEEEYIDTGKVKFAYVNTIFHGEPSTIGSLAAEEVWEQSPETYWEFQKALYDAQPDEGHDETWLTKEVALEVAQQFPSINVEELEKSLTEQEHISKITTDSSLIKEFNVEQTPTIFVNGVKLAAPSYEDLKSVIEEELE